MAASFTDSYSMVSDSLFSLLVVYLSVFQANSREIDVSLVRELYRPYISAQNDFLGTVGSYDYHTLSTQPEKTLNHATMVRPFDMYIWILIGVSLLIVMLTFIMIETVSSSMHGFIRIPTHQSM